MKLNLRLIGVLHGILVIGLIGSMILRNAAYTGGRSRKVSIIPPDRTRYLAEIAEAHDRYEQWVRDQVTLARQLGQVRGTIEQLRAEVGA